MPVSFPKGIVHSRVTVRFDPQVREFVDGSGNHSWHVIAHAKTMNVDLIDWGQTIGAIAHAILDFIVQKLLRHFSEVGRAI